MSLAEKMGALEALPHELTTMDRKASTRKGFNPYALGMYLGAAAEIREEVNAGADLADSFADHFTPTRGMHGVAKRLGLPLDVDRGRWIRTEA